MARGRTKQEPATFDESNIPKMPADLDDGAKDAWKSVVKDLVANNTIQKTDSKLIELYARSHSLLQRVSKELETAPLYNGGGKGRLFIHPLANLYPTLLAKDRQLLNDLGLTPGSRKGSGGGGDELTAFLRDRA